MSPRLGAVVVHYQRPRDIQNTIRDILWHVDLRNIVIVDNSGDLTLPADLCDVHVLKPKSNLGYAAGVNLGVQTVLSNSAVDYVLVSTHEVRYDRTSISRLLQTSIMSSGGIIAPLLCTTSEGVEKIWSAGGTISALGYPKHLKSPPSKSYKVKWVDGASFLIDRRSFERIGGVPEEFFLYMEDVALGLKCGQMGVPVVVDPRARAYQEATGPKRELAVRNRIVLAVRYYPARTRIICAIEFHLRTALLRVIDRRKAEENRRAFTDANAIIESCNVSAY